MTAGTADVANVLRLLGAAFPTFPLDELTLETYVRSLAASPLDAATLNAAAVAWVATEDRYPTVHQLTEAYQAEARRRMQERADAEAERIMRAGGLPGVALDPGYAVEMVDVMRTALAQVGRGGSPADLGATARRLAEDRGLRPPSGVETYACRTCHDLGHIIEQDDPMTVRPCGDCQPELHRRWADGHLIPGHTCAECRGQR